MLWYPVFVDNNSLNHTLAMRYDPPPDLGLLILLGSVVFEPVDWVATGVEVFRDLASGNIAGAALNAFLAVAPGLGGWMDDAARGVGNLGRGVPDARGFAAGGRGITLETFGGTHGQVPGAINVDIVAETGVRASALQLPFADESVSEVIANNPYIPHRDIGRTASDLRTEMLEEAVRVLEPGGQFIVNGQRSNPYVTRLAKLSPDELARLNITVEVKDVIDPRFADMIFETTDGRSIDPETMITVVITKME